MGGDGDVLLTDGRDASLLLDGREVDGKRLLRGFVGVVCVLSGEGYGGLGGGLRDCVQYLRIKERRELVIQLELMPPSLLFYPLFYPLAPSHSLSVSPFLSHFSLLIIIP